MPMNQSANAGVEQPGCSPARQAGVRKDIWVQKLYGLVRERETPSAGVFLFIHLELVRLIEELYS